MDAVLIVIGFAGFLGLASFLQRYDPRHVRERALATELVGRAGTTDDDLAFLWDDEDAGDVVRDLERAFNIQITYADAATVGVCSVRAVSLLVDRKTRLAVDGFVI